MELKNGLTTEYGVSEDRIWFLFNYVFSDSGRKRNTYKFGLVKSLLDNVFNGQNIDSGIKYTYEELFSRFAENYWNLVIKYDLRQMRKDGKSIYSKIESILMPISVIAGGNCATSGRRAKSRTAIPRPFRYMDVRTAAGAGICPGTCINTMRKNMPIGTRS